MRIRKTKSNKQIPKSKKGVFANAIKKHSIVEEFEYYNLILDGLIFICKDGDCKFKDKSTIDLCDLKFGNDVILSNSDFVDLVEDSLAEMFGEADGTYIVSGNVEVYVTENNIDSTEFLDIHFTNTDNLEA